MFKNLLKSLHRRDTADTPDPATERAKALVGAGNAAEDAGRVEEARALYRQAVESDPLLPATHLNLGIAEEALGDDAAARACYEQALALEEGHPFAAYNLGKLDYRQGRLATGEALVRQAIAGKADFVQAWVLLSNLLDAAGNPAGAADAIAEAVRLRPDQAGAFFNQAGILRQLGRIDEAQAAIEQAVRLEPGNVDCLVLQTVLLLAQGFAAEALVPLRHAITLARHRFDLRSKELFILNLVEGVPADELWERHRALGAEVEAAVPARQLPARATAKRLRIGYVSGDLRGHPVAMFLLPLLEGRDRERFEVFCYSSTLRTDRYTQQVERLSDHWVDAVRLTDAQLTDRIVADGIDILLDLGGHSGEVRLGVFVGKPAPVQASWIGYLNTTGLTRMDYRLTDARCDPAAQSQPLHSERLLYLPHSQWCYRPFADVPPAAVAPCERNGFVTFGSFNNAMKITREMALRWGRILRAVPDARLLVADVSSGAKREWLLAAIEEAGAEPGRVDFAPRTDLEAYYGLMHGVDIALDSYPYGGGTTTFDALWMGVPVVTASGDIPASRSAASILAALGLEQWIAPDVDGYEALAIARAADRPALGTLRRTLRERLRGSPLTDEPAFVAAFHGLLEEAWRVAHARQGLQAAKAPPQ
jgi:predicted O-linked N-acetylglucosamine transferase (SPINDLY family)